MVEAKEIDWAEINNKLPFVKNDEEKAKRKELFKQFDPNGNGYLSLAEVEKGVRDVLAVDELFDAKPAIHRAFHYAKKVSKGTNEKGDDYIEFREFRVFLQTLRQYFEYYQAFARTDESDDRRVTLVEFKNCQESLEKWVGKFDAEEEFKAIDKNDGGFILFNEFIDWALNKNLDLDDDED